MSSSSKVVIDSKGSNNMMYIPLDKLLEKANSQSPAADGDQQAVPYAPQVEESLLDRRSNRARAVR